MRQARQPVILHWLGEVFDPALAGYWGSRDPAAAETVLALIREQAHQIDGIKVSLLDRELEIALRRRLPEGVKMYTGDDFDYAELIEGDGRRSQPRAARNLSPRSHPRPRRLRCLGQGDRDGFRAVLDRPCRSRRRSS